MTDMHDPAPMSPQQPDGQDSPSPPVQSPAHQISPSPEAPQDAPSHAEAEPKVLPGKPPKAPRSKPQSEPTGPSVIVRYGLMRHIGEFRHTLKDTPAPTDRLVVRTDRGVELGEVVSVVSRDQNDPDQPCRGCISSEKLNQFLQTAGPEYPFRRSGRVLRIANQQDLVDFRHLQNSASEEIRYCRQRIREKNLPMRLVTAEHLLGGERIVLYFTSETRVDFRELVRDLAGQFRTRIEMRQVGARDEARLAADYERCGQRCCCQEFLKDLKPVSMRMAKVQKATLDPAKISGRCGRLMCCLRFEDECYGELRKNLPRKNTWVRTSEYLGKVIDTQIITQLVRLALVDNTQTTVGVDELVERDIHPPSEEQLQIEVKNHAIAQRKKALQAANGFTSTPDETKVEPVGDEDSSRKSSQARKPKKQQEARSQNRRSRQRKKKPAQAGKQPQQKQQPQGSGQDKDKKKRQRRRRRKKPRRDGQGA